MPHHRIECVSARSHANRNSLRRNAKGSSNSSFVQTEMMQNLGLPFNRPSSMAPHCSNQKRVCSIAFNVSTTVLRMREIPLMPRLPAVIAILIPGRTPGPNRLTCCAITAGTSSILGLGKCCRTFARAMLCLLLLPRRNGRALQSPADDLITSSASVFLQPSSFLICSFCSRIYFLVWAAFIGFGTNPASISFA